MADFDIFHFHNNWSKILQESHQLNRILDKVLQPPAENNYILPILLPNYILHILIAESLKQL